MTVTSETDERGAGDNVTLTGHHEATISAVQSVQAPVAAELRTDNAHYKQLLVPQGEYQWSPVTSDVSCDQAPCSPWAG